jgi:hypothetical protein
MRVLGIVIAALLLVAGYFWVVLSWNYSAGERAGWIQKFSNKGWLCKTWEGEMAMVSMPGAIPEKFYFTVWDDAVAAEINKVMGKRVSLHYEEKVGLPTSCFGETRHFVTRVTGVEDIPLTPGIVVPVPKPVPDPAAPQPAPAAPASK